MLIYKCNKVFFPWKVALCVPLFLPVHHKRTRIWIFDEKRGHFHNFSPLEMVI